MGGMMGVGESGRRVWRGPGQAVFRVPGSVYLLFFALCLSQLSAQEPAATGKPVVFSEVRAIFAAKCLACHGNEPAELRGEYDMRTREAAVRGGASGEAAIVPGQPDKSLLYLAVTWQIDGLQMPPKENDRLSAEQVAMIRRWIEAGAKWEEGSGVRVQGSGTGEWDAGAGGVRIPTSGGLSGEWDNRTYEADAVWSFRPVQHIQVPPAQASGVRKLSGNALSSETPDREAHASRSPSPIDAFLMEALQAKGIDGYAPPANARTLVRRLTIDLTGLPPSADDVEAFVAESIRNPQSAIRNRATELLASPRYGEQQARHWLDVVRYADTAGFSNDFERPNSWRYRDYVIRSFNADKPFDRFVLEQVAGDELGEEDPELLIAAGYLRMGPWEHTGMTVAAITRQQYLDDVTNHLGVSLLGQGLRCASCHDHKFDPVPTRDYYRMQAVFAPVQFAERPLAFLPHENTSGFDAARRVVEQRLAELQAAQEALRAKNRTAVAALVTERGLKSADELPEEVRSTQEYKSGTIGLTKKDLSLRKINNKSIDYLQRELKRFEPYALSVYSGPANNYTSVKPLYDLPRRREGTVEVVHILTGGSLESPADEVTPGVLSAMFRPQASSASEAIPDSAEGRRLALARWIASRENTLTARVIVNRVWQQHFGKGLVATPNNFGKMGARPTNPELLDWLAGWFIDNGWSLKKLHELIVTSAAYQQASDRPDTEQVREKDARNDLLAYYPPRRLAAEEIRDSLLAASGELNLEMGGPGVFPEMNWEVALQPRHIMGSVAPAYVPSRTPAERNRRTIYTFRIRTLADPMLEVLNRPGSETSCERRDETTVTPQVFALFNSEFAANRALAMAARLSKEQASDEERVQAAFQTVYGREPTAQETSKSLSHINRLTVHHQTHAPQLTELPTSVERGMVEEMTGEMVYWTENLEVLKDYERDLMPWQVDARTRALADLCLVLMNSNEFLYVR